MDNKDTSFPKKIAPLYLGGEIMDFSTPRIMGILNLTPDSFYDGGKYFAEEKWLEHTSGMLEEGADIIDIGAASTRPGATAVTAEEEIRRLLPPLKRLIREFPHAVFSIDTYHAEVARQCVEAGAHIINDISGGRFDKNMFSTVARLGVPYVLMHIHGTPQTMQQNPLSKNIVEQIKQFFEEKTARLLDMGVRHLILDPGFGFGKTLESNYELLRHLDNVRIDRLPILAGVSRKSMINKVIRTSPEEALNGTTVLHTLALLNGANLLRVHDVKEARQAIEIVEFYRTFGKSSN